MDEKVLYTPATIAGHAEDSGIIHKYTANGKIKLKVAKQRIRIALGRHSNNQKYPDEGDGTVTLKGQSPTPAWFGWRWQDGIGTEKWRDALLKKLEEKPVDIPSRDKSAGN